MSDDTGAGDGTEIIAQHYNGLASAIIAIQNELGTGLKGSRSTLSARLATLLNAQGAINSGTQFPTNPTPVEGQLFWRTDFNPKRLYAFDSALGDWVHVSGITDHGALAGLTDDDHPQYVRTDGSRIMTGDLLTAQKIRFRSGGDFDAILQATLTAQRTYTFPDRSDTLVTLGGAQTLLSKTLSNPVLSGTLSGGVLQPDTPLAVAFGGTGLNKYPAVVLRRDAPQSIANTSLFERLEPDVEELDTDNMWSGGTMVTIQTAGVYLLCGRVGFPDNNTGVRAVDWVINGNVFRNRPYRAGASLNSVWVGTSVLETVEVRFLNVFDTLRLLVFQDSGAPMNVTGEMAVVRLGPGV